MNTVVAVEMVHQCKVVVCENEIVFKKNPSTVSMRAVS